MYYKDDFYYEPSEFESKVDELKESLRNSVKQEIQKELDRLRKENESLREFKEQKDAIKRDHNEQIRKMQYEQENFMRDLKRKRISELLGDLSLVMWCPNSKHIELPKCDACDKYRKIHYKTPSGKDATEECPTCGISKYVWEPEEVEGYKFYQSKSRYGGEEYPGVSIYFNRKEQRDYDSFERCRYVYGGEPFEKVTTYSAVFKDKEDCQKYCDWLNSKKQTDN